MIDVLNIVFPIFFLGALGYIAVKWLGFPDSVSEGLHIYLFNIALPFMMVRLISNVELPAEIPWGIFGSYFGPQLLIYGVMLCILWLSGRRLEIQEGLAERAIIALTTVFGNLLLLGLPLMLRALGEESTLVLFLVMSVHSLIIVTLTLTLIEVGLQRDGTLRRLPLNIAASIGKNPVMIALLLGLLMNALDLRLPESFDQVAVYLQGSVTPCALFAVGASLVKFRLAGGHLARSLLFAPVKLLLMPVLVYLSATYIFQLQTLWILSLTLMAAMPSGVLPYILAGRYQLSYPFVTTSVTISHLFSIVTLSILIYFIRLGAG